MELWQERAVVFAAENITVVRRDPQKDLVWVGDDKGYIASFYGPLLRPYTSFEAHSGPVLDIQLSDKYVISLGADGVSSHRRNGLLVALSPTATGTVLLLLDNHEFLVGLKRRVKRFTLEPQIKETGFFEMDTIPEDAYLTHMSLSPPNIAIGLSNGSVQVVEPHTFDPVLPKAIQCHSGPLTDLDSRKNVLVTCGLSQRKYGLVPDVFAACFDARARKPLPPLSVSTGASFVRLHPKSPSHAIIANLSGQLTFLDSRNPTAIAIKQAAVHSEVKAIEIGPLGDSLVLAEKSMLHLWSTNPVQASSAESFKGLDVPTSVGRLPYVGPDVPLSAVGLPYFNQELLSSWNSGLIFELGIPTPDWSRVASPLVAQRHDTVRVRTRHRNRRTSSVSVPRFLSERERLAPEDVGTDVAFVDLMRADDSIARGKVPKLWRQMYVHYSKFGIDDFDFSFYNSTPYAGLEPLASNPFVNAVLQLYRWCPPIYNSALHTFARYNWRELTVTGELAIVIDMLLKANGHHCRATNLIDTLQLVENVGGLHRVLMEKLVGEYETEIGEESPLKLETHVQMLVKEYGSCGSRSTSETAVSTLNAPTLSVRGLQAALSRTADGRRLCEMCGKAHPVVSSQQALSQPPTIFVTTDPRENSPSPSSSRSSSPDSGIDGEETGLCAHFGLVPRADSKLRIDPTLNTYTLQGYVAEVENEGDRHAVAVIKIGDMWYLFNDFLVTTISETEALDLSQAWKHPALLMYGRTENPVSFDYSWKEHVDKRLLKERYLVSGNLHSESGSDVITLSEDEPVPALVALDAEFVMVRNEVAEVHSDGTKYLMSPKKLSLARVSVLRDDERVLIDDLVETKQPVVDYVTAFSGIEPGDLDPFTSRFGLVARQTATRRLWILLNSGTKFVGHALYNDFRTINLFVPPDQVIDTINLFHDRDRNGFRRLSLKFLMWAVLGEQVQTGNHDSVQDAVSALRLYQKYRELVATNQLDNVLAEVSTKGQKHNYRVPALPTGEISAPGTPTHW